MSTNGWHHRLGDRIVRRPRQRELMPVRIKTHNRRRRLVPASTSALFSLAIGFAALITTGTALLMLPAANTDSTGASFVTALFTATSATCVTGLVVVETGAYWTGFGQAVVAVLMLAGGLGIMTAGLVVLMAVGRRITLNQRLVVRESMGGGTSLGGVLQMGRVIIIFAAVVQIAGAIVLFARLSFDFPALEAAGLAAFHAISAFNNAGFTIFQDSDSLSAFQSRQLFLLITAVLIVLGAISYPVVAEFMRRRRPNRWALDTRLVLIGTVGLWALAALSLLAFELGNPATLGGLSWVDKIGSVLFQSVTARTAGFSSIDFSQTRAGNDFFFMLLMFVGGASGSAAGGIKVNTAMVLLVAGLASIRGRSRVEVFGREIPYPQLTRALAVVLLALTALFFFIMALAATESSQLSAGAFSFTDVMFEATSAFGTTGLSRGITADLSSPGKLVVTLAMYVGRLGPLTIALGLALRERRAVYRLAQEQVRIG